MGLIQDIGEGPVGLDTAAFIYFIEEHPRLLSVVAPVFEAVAAGRLLAATSGLTLLEVLVVPHRAGDTVLAERYEALLTRSRGLRMIDLDRSQLRAAAQLRAAHASLRTPDALQVAAAITSGCASWVTNDGRLPALPGLRVLLLERYAKSR